MVSQVWTPHLTLSIQIETSPVSSMWSYNFNWFTFSQKHDYMTLFQISSKNISTSTIFHQPGTLHTICVILLKPSNQLFWIDLTVCGGEGWNFCFYVCPVICWGRLLFFRKFSIEASNIFCLYKSCRPYYCPFWKYEVLFYFCFC